MRILGYTITIVDQSTSGFHDMSDDLRWRDFGFISRTVGVRVEKDLAPSRGARRR